MTIYYYLHQQSEAGLLRFSLEYQQTSAAFIIPTYGCSLAIEQAAVRLRKIEGKTVTTDTLSLHPRRTPRVWTQSLQHSVVQFNKQQLVFTVFLSYWHQLIVQKFISLIVTTLRATETSIILFTILYANIWKYETFNSASETIFFLQKFICFFLTVGITTAEVTDRLRKLWRFWFVAPYTNTLTYLLKWAKKLIKYF